MDSFQLSLGSKWSYQPPRMLRGESVIRDMQHSLHWDVFSRRNVGGGNKRIPSREVASFNYIYSAGLPVRLLVYPFSAGSKPVPSTYLGSQQLHHVFFRVLALQIPPAPLVRLRARNYVAIRNVDRAGKHRKSSL